MKRCTKTPLMKEVDRILKLPMPPPFQVYPIQQTAHEKKMAKLMQKFIDYQWIQMKATKMIKTPWGILMWSPNDRPTPGKKEKK